MRIILIISIFFLTSCDTDKLNQRSAKINNAVAEATKSISGFDFGSKKGFGSSQFSNKARALPRTTSRINSTNSLVKTAKDLGFDSLDDIGLSGLGDSLNEVNRTYKQTKATIEDTKKQYDSAKSDLKRSARQIANQIPRSEREANQFVRNYTKDFVEFVRARLKGSNFSFNRNSSIGRSSRTIRRNNEGRKR